MRKSVLGAKRKRALLLKGVGYKKPTGGQKKRKSVRGNQIDQDVQQVNLTVVKTGKKKLGDVFKKPEKPQEAPKK